MSARQADLEQARFLRRVYPTRTIRMAQLERHAVAEARGLVRLDDAWLDEPEWDLTDAGRAMVAALVEAEPLVVEVERDAHAAAKKRVARAREAVGRLAGRLLGVDGPLGDALAEVRAAERAERRAWARVQEAVRRRKEVEQPGT